MSLAKRLDRLEAQAQPAAGALPAWLVGADLADLAAQAAALPAGARVKGYVGISPDDWNDPDADRGL